MDWLGLRAVYIVGICLFWFTFVYLRCKENPSILKDWGIQKQGFRQAFFFLLPFSISCVTAALIFGLLGKGYPLNWHILPFIVLYPLWGLIQQFILLGLITGNLKAFMKGRFSNTRIIFVTSILFSLIHYPDWYLMIFTFVMEWFFTMAFLRWKNIWPLGLFHGWIATFVLFFILGRDLWIELIADF